MLNLTPTAAYRQLIKDLQPGAIFRFVQADGAPVRPETYWIVREISTGTLGPQATSIWALRLPGGNPSRALVQPGHDAHFSFEDFAPECFDLVHLNRYQAALKASERTNA